MHFEPKYQLVPCKHHLNLGLVSASFQAHCDTFLFTQHCAVKGRVHGSVLSSHSCSPGAYLFLKPDLSPPPSQWRRLPMLPFFRGPGAQVAFPHASFRSKLLSWLIPILPACLCHMQQLATGLYPKSWGVDGNGWWGTFQEAGKNWWTSGRSYQNSERISSFLYFIFMK